MTKFQESLDRHITGNYGEDQVRYDPYEECCNDLDKLGNVVFKGAINDVVEKHKKMGLKGEDLKDVREWIRQNFKN